MNEVFENNAAITSIRNFYMNYRKVNSWYCSIGDLNNFCLFN